MAGVDGGIRTWVLVSWRAGGRKRYAYLQLAWVFLFDDGLDAGVDPLEKFCRELVGVGSRIVSKIIPYIRIQREGEVYRANVVEVYCISLEKNKVGITSTHRSPGCAQEKRPRSGRGQRIWERQPWLNVIWRA